MAVSAELLRELHRIHQQLADLSERLERGPRQLRAREVNVENLTQQREAAAQAVRETKMAVDQKQLDLKSSEAKIEDLKTKLNTSNSNKEYHALQEQIAAAEMAASVLADEILEAFDKVDRLEAKAAEASDLLESGRRELEKNRTLIAEDAAIARAEIERLTGQLKEAEKQLPLDARDDYQRVIRGKGAEGLAAAEGRTCTGCGQQITLNRQNDLMLSKPVYCTACGRLLYVSE